MNKQFSADDWAEVADLIEQCIGAADVDNSYARIVRDKAIAMLVRIRDEATDNGLQHERKSRI